jgi:hypothetical protein
MGPHMASGDDVSGVSLTIDWRGLYAEPKKVPHVLGGVYTL